MITRDDRTPAQKLTHTWGVVAKDKSMSGWGGAASGASRCAWACAPEVNIERVLNWIKSRKEMQYASIVDLRTYRAPRGTAHFRVYVAEANHPAAKFCPGAASGELVE